MLRKIVFINQATGYLAIDIINEFAMEFDEVALITGSIRIQDVTLDQKVIVSSIIKYNRGNTLQIYWLLVGRYRKFEKFYFTIPPTSYLMAHHFKDPYAVLVYDLYPDALLSFGFTSKGLLYKKWSKLNKRIFTGASRVFTISEKMKSHILKYAGKSEVTVIPNWSAFEGLSRVKKEENRLIAEYNLYGKFIVQYSGNIGVTHKVEVLVEAAEMLSSSDDIMFIIIGRGERMKNIGSLIKERQLKNCLILPFRKDDELWDSLCAADLAVITLDDKTPDISIPSKIYNILAAGLPVMAIAARNSGISNTIDRHQNGNTFEKDDLEGMCKFITKLKDSPDYRTSLSKRSLIAAQNYTRTNAKKYCEVYLNQ